MNLLYNKRWRSKRKIWTQFFTLKEYYELNWITLREKIYTFCFNQMQSGFITQGEYKWCERMMGLDSTLWFKIEAEFKKDYIEFLNDPENKKATGLEN